MDTARRELQMNVLQQFRIIYGSLRQYFREMESCCGLPGAQAWVLQEVEHTPGIGITELAGRLGIHQSTCSGLVDKLVGASLLAKQRSGADQRRIGLVLLPAGKDVLGRLPGPAEGVLPSALAEVPVVCLKTLNINLMELIRHMPARRDRFANTLLAEMLRDE